MTDFMQAAANGFAMGQTIIDTKNKRTLASLMQQAYEGPREARGGLLAQMAGVGGVGAVNDARKALGAADDDLHTELVRQAQMFVSLPAEQRAQMYPQMADTARKLNFPVPQGGWDDAYLPGIEKLASFAGGGQSAGLGEFRALTSGLSPEDAENARRIKLGLAPRAVTGAAKSVTLEDENGVPRTFTFDPTTRSYTPSGLVGRQKEVEAGAIENAKIGAQIGNAGRITAIEADRAGAVETAKTRAQQAGEKTERDRSNASAYRVYEQGLKGLTGGLDAAETGPIIGRLPALTANQQVAQGGVDAMAPILKQMFRSAGEGTFTDKDQELLLSMLPTRKDLPEARKAKLANIDNIVRAKLGLAPAGLQAPSKQIKRRGTLNGRKVVQYTDGSIEYAD